MFNHMVEDSVVLDRTYRALGDATRRRLLRELGAGKARITDLAAPLPMSFAAVARHVAVLERAGLVAREVRGREHWLSVRRGRAGTDAERWIGEQTAFWGRAEALAEQLAREARVSAGGELATARVERVLRCRRGGVRRLGGCRGARRLHRPAPGTAEVEIDPRRRRAADRDDVPGPRG